MSQNLTLKQIETALTSNELADLLDTNVQMIRASRISGSLFGIKSPPFYRLGRNKIFYLKKDVQDYLNNSTKQTITHGYS